MDEFVQKQTGVEKLTSQLDKRQIFITNTAKPVFNGIRIERNPVFSGKLPQSEIPGI